MIRENFVINKKGHKIAVQIPIRVYEKLMADSEELIEIKAYDHAKTRKSEPIPFEQAVKEIELLRNSRV